MPLARAPLILRILAPLLAAASLAACSGSGDEAVRQLRSAAARDAQKEAHDPCMLILRQEEDVDIGGPGGTQHLSMRYDYANVRAPAGAD